MTDKPPFEAFVEGASGTFKTGTRTEIRCCHSTLKDSVRLAPGEPLISVPRSGDKLGQEELCTRCINQLACLTGSMEHKDRIFRRS